MNLNKHRSWILEYTILEEIQQANNTTVNGGRPPFMGLAQQKK
jgi:hypothetical protein